MTNIPAPVFEYYKITTEHMASIVRSLNNGARVLDALKKEINTAESNKLLYAGQAFGL